MDNKTSRNLYTWYQQNQRDLPWRKSQDPYRIWISETMLQQTTSQAVIPYFERFLKLFPSLKALAQAPTEEVLEAWAGLGYYSRARNLHKAAQALVELKEFPQQAEDLIKFPGFGPYTSRAVASIAFNQRVGVLDGNVIRVLSRFYNWPAEWWKGPIKKELQNKIDTWVKVHPPRDINQAVMELGATVCMPKNPSCWTCPLRPSCLAYSKDTQNQLPLKKPKRDREIWHWEISVVLDKGRVGLIKNDYAPFLKGQWLLPGTATQLKKVPTTFNFRHSITHHDIFVTLKPPSPKINKTLKQLGSWAPIHDVKKWIPASLVSKAMEYAR